jgi:hypothetical protein
LLVRFSAGGAAVDGAVVRFSAVDGAVVRFSAGGAAVVRFSAGGAAVVRFSAGGAAVDGAVVRFSAGGAAVDGAVVRFSAVDGAVVRFSAGGADGLKDCTAVGNSFSAVAAEVLLITPDCEGCSDMAADVIFSACADRDDPISL